MEISHSLAVASSDEALPASVHMKKRIVEFPWPFERKSDREKRSIAFV
jgi:hypothetical protein